jgi:hypothetical protein
MMSVMELLALAQRRGLCVGAGDCRLLLHLGDTRFTRYGW